FKRIAASHPPGYPAKEDSPALVGHITEGWLLTGQLPAGVAIYDESKTIYESAARLFFKKFRPDGKQMRSGDTFDEMGKQPRETAVDVARGGLL
ncbi:hypothetical protein DRP77_01815, partial [Candidatus Poribacteria bacterium]